ncbi:MAG: hypothetical protein CBB87_00240 [Micavibrio sp. TMED27]|nr:hypothetical protein [Micavibrio sp.]OUT93023.1 MAG: hypothetical protein CBB87_00240 [Micavibrio sp. TMED27]|tara:strand:- start:20908 stop:21855 length:948 start_codon:yes stop_codon:yes gene_type:complete
MSVKIAVLETIHDAGLEVLALTSNVEHFEGLSRAELLSVIHDYDVIILKSNIQVDREFLERAQALKIVARAGVGVDNIDCDLLEEKGIKLITTPTGNTISTAEFTIGLIMNLIRRMPEINTAVQNNDFRRHLYEGRELSQLSIGIVGLGNTGMAVARRLSPFGCKLYGCDRTMRRETIFADLGGKMVETIDEMLEHIDVLTLHVPSTDKTSNMVNESVFNRMKKGSFLINTARGDIVNKKDLIEALDNGVIASAALDVIHPEPPYNAAPEQHDFSHALINHPRILFTPHIAASTNDAQKRMSLQIAEEIKAFFSD